MRSTLIVLYDACTLYSAVLRDLLMELALTGLIQARRNPRWYPSQMAVSVTIWAEEAHTLNPEQWVHVWLIKAKTVRVPASYAVEHRFNRGSC